MLFDEPLYGSAPHLYVAGEETGATSHPNEDSTTAAAQSGASLAGTWMRQQRDKDRWASARFQGCPPCRKCCTWCNWTAAELRPSR